ncbi:MAG: DNA gyrase inhibitor YacG [Candidatus Rokuibacteriota bacterium]
MKPDGEAERRPPAGGVRCPTCQGVALWAHNPHRPFCSVVCRLVDLGVWLDEGYRIERDPDVP